MSTRITRAAAAKLAESLSASDEKNPGQEPVVASNLEEKPNSIEASNGVSKRKVQSKKNQSQAKPAIKPVKEESDPDELPHNLGKAFVPTDGGQINKRKEPTDELSPPKRKRSSKNKPAAKTNEVPTGINDVDKKVVEKKKVPKVNPHKLTPGVSPFPDWPHPTPEECQEVTDLLSSVHGIQAAPAAIPAPSLTVSGCGEVPSILDAMIRTLLSAATTGKNSSSAFKGLVDKFGILDDGIGKGSVNWDAVRRAPRSDVLDAIKSGGLAAVKSGYIHDTLEMVHEENQARRAALVDPSVPDPHPTETQTPSQKAAEVARADDHVLSLDHLHAMDTHDAMLAMTRYPGIGVKTASCVLLFCMRRPSLAVDTHVFRLLRWLRWVPPRARDEIAAFKHVDAVVPDRFKYALHQLFIKHGKACPRCRAATREGYGGWEEGCVIEHLVLRTKKEHARNGPRARNKVGDQSDTPGEAGLETRGELHAPSDPEEEEEKGVGDEESNRD